jgi:hypothetical protein
MKLFEMEGFLRGKCIPRDLKVNETNAEYLVRKFAEADAMCAALAAENAGLKAAIETHKHGFVVVIAAAMNLCAIPTMFVAHWMNPSYRLLPG